MRRSALPSAFGALGQRGEWRMLSLTIQLSRESSFSDRPAKPFPGQFGNRFVEWRALKGQVVRLGTVGLVGCRASPGLTRRLSSHAFTQSANSAVRGS